MPAASRCAPATVGPRRLSIGGFRRGQPLIRQARSRSMKPRCNRFRIIPSRWPRKRQPRQLNRNNEERGPVGTPTGPIFLLPLGNLKGAEYAVTLRPQGILFATGAYKHMISRVLSVKSLIALMLILGCAASAWAGQWAVMGPDGGDVRSLAYDPQNPDRIFLGTSTGVIFVSNNGGQDWSRFAHLGTGDDYVLDHIALNPKNSNIIYVSAWSAHSQQVGDMFR